MFVNMYFLATLVILAGADYMSSHLTELSRLFSPPERFSFSRSAFDVSSDKPYLATLVSFRRTPDGSSCET